MLSSSWNRWNSSEYAASVPAKDKQQATWLSHPSMTTKSKTTSLPGKSHSVIVECSRCSRSVMWLRLKPKDEICPPWPFYGNPAQHVPFTLIALHHITQMPQFPNSLILGLYLLGTVEPQSTWAPKTTHQSTNHSTKFPLHMETKGPSFSFIT